LQAQTTATKIKALFDCFVRKTRKKYQFNPLASNPNDALQTLKMEIHTAGVSRLIFAANGPKIHETNNPLTQGQRLSPL